MFVKTPVKEEKAYSCRRPGRGANKVGGKPAMRGFRKPERSGQRVECCGKVE